VGLHRRSGNTAQLDQLSQRCGLVEPNNACRCAKRADMAVALGRVDPQHLLFASSVEQAHAFPEVLHEIRRLERTQRAAALYRAHPQPPSSERFVLWLRQVLEQGPAPS
jgi:hypothetical protein